MVYSPVVMKDCNINVNYGSNGNIAVGLGESLIASGCTFESNDVGIDAFGDSSKYMTDEMYDSLLSKNTFIAQTRISRDIAY